MVIVAIKMPFDRAEGYRILPFNPIALQVEEEDDGEVVELERSFKIRRVIGLVGMVIYEF